MNSRDTGTTPIGDGEPQQPARRRAMTVLSWASYLDRALTWGIEPGERDEILREREADRYEHVADPSASMALAPIIHVVV